MLFLIEFSNAIRDFIEAGGQVLLVIGILIFTMWLMILERIFITSMATALVSKTCVNAGGNGKISRPGMPSKFARQ